MKQLRVTFRKESGDSTLSSCPILFSIETWICAFNNFFCLTFILLVPKSMELNLQVVIVTVFSWKTQEPL